MREHILVVEDDEKSRRLLRDVLGFHGYAVSVAADGEAALEQAQRERPDAALLDIQLGGMDGFGVLAALRAMHARVPVIAVTASVMDTERERILVAGFDAFVPKPVNIRQLLLILRNCLTRS